jgi:hypothetical protein
MTEKSAFLAKLFLRALCTAIRQNHAWSRGFFFRAENAESAEKQPERRSAKDSFSAPSAPLRAHVPSGTVLVAACRVRPWIITYGTRCFEQEKTERTEHRWTWSISLFPLLPPVQIMCLVAVCRAASLRLCAFALNPECLAKMKYSE